MLYDQKEQVEQVFGKCSPFKKHPQEPGQPCNCRIREAGQKYPAIKESQSAFEEKQHARAEACEVHNMSERRRNLVTSVIGEMRDSLVVSVRAKKAAGEVCQLW